MDYFLSYDDGLKMAAFFVFCYWNILDEAPCVTRQGALALSGSAGDRAVVCGFLMIQETFRNLSLGDFEGTFIKAGEQGGAQHRRSNSKDLGRAALVL